MPQSQHGQVSEQLAAGRDNCDNRTDGRDGTVMPTGSPFCHYASPSRTPTLTPQVHSKIHTMNAQLAGGILKTHYPGIFASGSLHPVEQGGFSGASIVRVETEAGPFCLRRWPPGTMTAKRLAVIHRLLGDVFRAGFTVIPVPVPTRDGCNFVESQGTFWQLEPWMPGKADFHEQPSDARLESAMTTLAEFHLAAAAASSESVRQGCPRTISERLEILQATRRDFTEIQIGLEREPDAGFHKLATELATQFARRATGIEVELQEARRIAVPILPCLRDVWHDHLLFSGEKLTGLVDFGAMRPDTVAADLSRLLGSLLETRRMSTASPFGEAQALREADSESLWRDQPRWDQALSLYEKTRRLTDAERRLIPLLDASGILLSGTHWLRVRYLGNSPVNLPRVRERLSSIVSRLTTIES